MRTEIIEAAQQALQLAQKNSVDACEVSASAGCGYRVTVRNAAAELVEHEQSKELTITVYHQHRTATTSTTDLNYAAINAAVKKACQIVKYTEKDDYAGLAAKVDLAFQYPELNLYHHWDITPQIAIDYAINCERYALSLDKRIQSEGVVLNTEDEFQVYANSLGFLGHYATSAHGLTCMLLAKDNVGMQRDYAYTVARCADDLEDFQTVAQRAVQNTMRRIGARKITTRKCPVLFSAPIAKHLWGSLISAISGYKIYRKTSFLQGKLGEKILPQHITVRQQPHLLGAMGSAPYDNEGVITRDIDYVKKGVLQSYVMDSYAARKLGLSTTGNAGGVFNLSMTCGDQDLPSLLRMMDTGLVVIEMLGQGVQIINGHYSRAAVGLWVERGEIQYPVHEVTVAGNLMDMFANILAIGSDVDVRGNIRTGSVLIDAMTVAGK